jgi:hypothetical protein
VRYRTWFGFPHPRAHSDTVRLHALALNQLFTENKATREHVEHAVAGGLMLAPIEMSLN